MRALITGIGGFVGPYLTRYLISENFDVVGIDKNPSPDAHVFSIDILDKDKVLEVVSEVKPDFVFHLAAQSSVEQSWDIPEITRNVNVNGTKNLLDAIVKAKLKPRILVVSSAEVYGIPRSVPIKETARLNPLSPYAESRVEQEKLALKYAKEKKLHIVVSRSFHHTGPGQMPSFVCSDFARQIAEVEKGLKKPEILVGNLQAKRDFTDVRDMVRAYLLSLQKCKPDIYNLCSGKAYAIKDVLNMLLKMSDVKMKVKQDKSKFRRKDIPVLEGDNTKFVKATGWKQQIKFEQTLRGILDYWREQV